MNHNNQLKNHKKNSVNQVFNWMLALMCIATPLSLSRWFVTGFLYIYIVHIAITLAAVLLFIYRKSIPSNIIEIFLVICCFMIGISSTLTFGLSINSASMFMLLLLVLSIKHPKRFVFSISSIYILVLCVFGYFFCTKQLVPRLDLDSVLEHPMTWISQLSIMIIAGFSAINELLSIYKLKNNLLNKIEDQRQEIEHLANHDNLTGLPTLRLAKDRLEISLNLAERNKSRAFLLFLDLDGFKQVNDSLGHDAGDTVLRLVAKKMRQAIRTTDTCCRIGGDEFLIIISDVSSIAPVERICQNLIEQIKLPIDIEGNSITIGVSIGGASYPNDGIDEQTLKRKADERMYNVKMTGKNNFLLDS